MSILFVCTGNTCRSPMAEVFAKDILLKNSMDYIVYSRGLHVCNLGSATKEAQEVIEEYGLELINHRSMQITKEDITMADIIFMFYCHCKNYILKIYKEESDKVYTLKEYAECEKNNLDILDPYGYEIPIYRKCAKEIKKYVEMVVEKLDSYRQ